VDIAREYSRSARLIKLEPNKMSILLMELYRNDEILADREQNRYSLNKDLQKTTENPDSPYELFSDRIKRLFPTYILDNKLRLMPGPDASVVDYEELRDLLLSKDLSRASELDWADNGEVRFLN
jgi:hypothetical protein